MIIYNNTKDGFVALMGVLIVGLVAAFLVPALLIVSTDNFQISKSINSSKIAENNANSCAETALEKLRLNSSYTGNETITLPYGNCTIQTITGSGSNRTIQTLSTIDNYTKKVKVEVTQLSPQITISSWDIVSDF